MDFLLLQYLTTGVTVGAIYALVALGFVLIVKASGILNFTQGEILMVGGFFAWSMLVQFQMPFWLALLATLGLGCIIGLALQRWPIRAMIGQPHLPIIMVTIALGVMLRGITILFWGGVGWRKFPEVIPIQPVSFGGMLLSRTHLFALLVCLVVIIALFLFFRYSKLGLNMLTLAEDHQVAQSMGISAERVIGISWVLAAMLAIVAGVLMASISGVELNMGVVGFKAIAGALAGGMNSLPGAVLGGMVIGVSEALGTAYIGRGVGEIMAFIVLLLVLFIRPQGFFGAKIIERV